jgi:hypothetical protein
LPAADAIAVKTWNAPEIYVEFTEVLYAAESRARSVFSLGFILPFPFPFLSSPLLPPFVREKRAPGVRRAFLGTISAF